jgi:hypothetical protein
MNRPTEADIKETSKLEDDSDVCVLLYNARKIESETAFMFQEDGQMYPILEAIIPKNKLNDISGYDIRLFYKFYPHLGLLEECSEEEQEKYASMK